MIGERPNFISSDQSLRRGPGLRADSKTRAEIEEVLNRFKDVVAARDYDGTLSLFSSDPDVFVSGSEEGETATGPDELKAFFKRIYGRPVSYEFNWRSFSVSSRGQVAWAHVDASVKEGGKNDSSSPYSMSIVMEKRGSRWLIAHYQGSEPTGSRWK